MALVSFKKGLQANLPSTHAEGTFYIATDERAIYLDISDSARIRLGDFREVASISALSSITNPNATALYYAANENCLAKWNPTGGDSGTGAWVQINPDTGATGIDVTGGEANGITASYNPTTRKISIAFGKTFLTDASLSDITGDIADLKAKVGDKAVSAQISEAIAALKLDETYAKAAHTHDMDDVDGLSDALEEKADADDLNALQETVGKLGDTYETKADATSKKEALEASIALKADKTAQEATDAKVEAIKADYLTSSDKDELEAADSELDERVEELEGKIVGLSGAMHFKGVVSTDPSAIKEGYENGDVVIFGNKEYVWNAATSAFVEFGDVTEVSGRVTTLENEMDAAESDIDALEEKLTGVGETVTGYVGGQIDAAKSALIGNEDGISATTIQGAAKEAIEYTNNALDDIDADIGEIQETLEGLGDKYDAKGTAASAVGALQTADELNDFGAVEDAIGEINDTLGGLDDKYAAAEHEHEMDDVDGLDEALDAKADKAELDKTNAAVSAITNGDSMNNFKAVETALTWGSF